MKKNKLIAMLLFTFVFISSFQMVYSEELEELSSQQSKIEQMKTLVSSFFVSAEDLEQREAIESALNEILNRIDAIEERVQSRIEEVERANAVEAVEGWEKFKHPYYGFEINFPSDIWCGEVDDYKWSPGSIGISDTYLAFSSLDDEVCVRGICPGCPIIVESPILLFVCEEGSWKEPDKDCVTEEGFSAHYYANFSEPKLEDSTKRALLELNEEQTYRIEMILFDDDYEEIFDNMVFSYSEKGTTNGFYGDEEEGFNTDVEDEFSNTFCGNLPFFDEDDYYDYKVDLLIEGNNPDFYESGRTGDIVTFENLIACSYFDGTDTYVIIESKEDENYFRQVSRNEIQTEGAGADFYIKEFSPDGNFLIYIENLYASYRVKIYDIEEDEVIDMNVNDLAFAELYGFTPDEKYFYVCSDTDYHEVRYAKIYNVPDFDVHYDLAEEEQVSEQYEDMYKISCEYDEDRSVLEYTLTERYKEKGLEKVIEYLFDEGEAIAVE
jgi:hypothetical protein